MTQLFWLPSDENLKQQNGGFGHKTEQGSNKPSRCRDTESIEVPENLFFFFKCILAYFIFILILMIVFLGYLTALSIKMKAFPNMHAIKLLKIYNLLLEHSCHKRFSMCEFANEMLFIKLASSLGVLSRHTPSNWISAATLRWSTALYKSYPKANIPAVSNFTKQLRWLYTACASEQRSCISWESGEEGRQLCLPLLFIVVILHPPPVRLKVLLQPQSGSRWVGEVLPLQHCFRTIQEMLFFEVFL